MVDKIKIVKDPYVSNFIHDRDYGGFWICPNCAKMKIHVSFSFCPGCGLPIEWEEKPITEKPLINYNDSWINKINTENN